MSCHKNCMTTCNNTLVHRSNAINSIRVNKACLIEIMIILKAIKSYLKGSYDKQNLTLMVISNGRVL